MTKQTRIGGLIIILTVAAGGGIRMRMTLRRHSYDKPPDANISDSKLSASTDHGVAHPQPPIISFSHPELTGSRITFNNEKKVTTIAQTVAVTGRQPGLHHGEGNAPSLPRIMADYGIVLSHLEHRIYSYDDENGLMVWSNDKSFIYYDPNTSSIFAAKIDDHLIRKKKPIITNNASPRTAKK